MFIPTMKLWKVSRTCNEVCWDIALQYLLAILKIETVSNLIKTSGKKMIKHDNQYLSNVMSIHVRTFIRSETATEQHTIRRVIGHDKGMQACYSRNTDSCDTAFSDTHQQ